MQKGIGAKGTRKETTLLFIAGKVHHTLDYYFIDGIVKFRFIYWSITVLTDCIVKHVRMLMV